MAAVIRHLLPTLFPALREYEHWIVISHQGKSDLERSYPRKMQEWREPGVRFMLLRDNDGADCRALKQRLISRISDPAPEYLVRIVCQELECWLLGDMNAVAAAYPAAVRHQKFKHLAKRDPDRLNDAAGWMKQLTGTQSKTIRASTIAKHLQPTRNRSTSFQVFLSGLQRLFAE